jgi:hypothetical protein
MADKLDLEDEFDPLPWSIVLALAVAVTLGSWMVLDWAARLSVELFAARVTPGAMTTASGVAAALAALAGLGGLASFVWTDLTGLVAERDGDRLRLVQRTRVSSQAVEVPLAEVRAIEIEGSTLVLQTSGGPRRVRLPGRSQEAQDALEAFVARLGK